jgi:hypothetical protein
MTDSINQMRLSMRLDTYLREYTGKNAVRGQLANNEWNNVWQVADIARTNKDLTPAIVDDVRIALSKL